MFGYTDIIGKIFVLLTLLRFMIYKFSAMAELWFFIFFHNPWVRKSWIHSFTGIFTEYTFTCKSHVKKK